MNSVYVIFNSHEFVLPNAAIYNNQEIVSSYSSHVNNKDYLNIDKMVADDKMDYLLKISHDCVSSIGMNALAIDDDYYMEQFNKINALFKDYVKKSEMFFKNGDKNSGYGLVLSGLEIAINFFNDMFSDEYSAGGHKVK